MTLAVRPKPSVHHKKRVGQHRKHDKHYAKAYWPYLPLIAVFAIGLLANTWLGRMHHDVLGYATEMSIQNLLDNTNAQRSANSETALTLNSQLNQAAQAKANDMAARNYWSHNTPDGQTPWTFVTAAGYNYQAVGENLAYGFATSSDTVTGWMNSPGHRANILNSNYSDVGFGVVNISDYQSSGPQTLVVAFYAHPTTAVATPAPSKPVSVPAPSSTAQSSSSGGAPTSATPTSDAAPADETPATTNTAKDDTVTPATKPIDKTVNEHRVARVQLFTSGNASWSLFALTILSTLAVTTFMLRHALAWHRFLIRGERFVLHHPAFDVAMIGLAMLGFILAQTSGFIR
jgi:hypothetical protein